ncbi:MAG: methionyl-tRNA formyltransferase, partial [Proteobacteria bacterium]|nr:methionyl-tRNA formyltransferase [Pseudomonadota bacterium]
MNILFAGTPQPSSKILEILSQDKDINIVGAITKADKAQKRGKKLEESPVSALCNKLNIKTFKPESLNSEEFKTEMLGIDFDFLVVAAYGKILPNWFLNCANIMSINVHYSLLPKYRGASPIQSSLLNGDAITGITFMKISEGLDEGEVIKQFELKINDTHNKVLLEND